MDSSNRLDIFQIYTRYAEVTLEVHASEGDGYKQANETTKAKVTEGLSQLLELVGSRVYKRMSILEEVSVLMSKLNPMVDFREFSRFYNFVFFVCRENSQKSITVSSAIMAWKLVLSGRFRLLNQWCSFVENNQRHNISEDTWRQVLAFSRCVNENLEGYDLEGAWPVLIDEFVEHMYRIRGSDNTRSLYCKCGDPETQPIYKSLPGLKVFPGAKRKLDQDMQGQGFDTMDAFMIYKRRHAHFTDNIVNGGTYDYVEHGKQHNPPCAVEGCITKGFAQLFSGRSSLQFDHESRVSFT